MTSLGHHHLSMRKRIYKKLEPYPSPNALTRFMDRAMYVIALIGPLATLPQVFQIFETQDVEGLSALTWGIWTLLSCFWVVYGLIHRETPIVLSNAIYI